MELSVILKIFAFKRVYFIYITVMIILFTPVSFADEIDPSPHNVTLSVNMDKASLPSAIMIFDNIFGGQTAPAKYGDASMLNENRWNTLTCLSRVDTTNGACPTNLYWGNGTTAPTMAGRLVLRFSQQGTRKTADLVLDGIKRRPNQPNVSLWNAAGNVSGLPITMSVSIPRSELVKLTPGKEPWKAHLVMNLSRWSSNCTKQYDVNSGCPGKILFSWTADIILKITDSGTQLIYFPEYSYVRSPVVNLGLKINMFGTSSATASANKEIDMCLYDGSNSSSNQISMLFSDEGRIAPGREEGDFSLYNSNDTDSENRLDYNLSVVNPKTGLSQKVFNKQEIVWTGVSADEGNVRTRLVKLPGINGMVQCVPAPLTIGMPEFKLSSKSKGYYTGILRVIYTPTTQSWNDAVNNI